MAGRNPPWSRDELILAPDLYLRRRPISRVSKDDPDVLDLSRTLNALPIHTNRPDVERFRNPNGVYMKLGNFSRLDPNYDGSGLTRGGAGEEPVWHEFANDSERLRRAAEAIRAIATAGHAGQASAQPGAADDAEFVAPEGRLLYGLHRDRERDRNLVRRKKESVLRAEGEFRCEACGFSFAEQYAELGEGFIECHHRKPLSRLRPGQHGTRLADLALVCANCHRMLHRGGEPLTVEQLQQRIAHRFS